MVSPVATAQQIAATSQTRRRPRLQFMKPHTKEAASLGGSTRRICHPTARADFTKEHAEEERVQAARALRNLWPEGKCTTPLPALCFADQISPTGMPTRCNPTLAAPTDL